MDRVTILIPTRNRLAKLRMTLASIPDREWIDVLVVCDGDPETASALTLDPPCPRLWVKLIEEHVGSVAARNAALAEHGAIPDGLLYFVDDADFLPGSIEAAVAHFNDRFTDQDGVVGFVQKQPDFHPSGVALMGRRFRARYPEGKVFYPKYWHFAAQEVYWLAGALGRFSACQEAVIRHHHPGFDKTQDDKTHHEARRKANKDRALRDARQRAGQIWGKR